MMRAFRLACSACLASLVLLSATAWVAAPGAGRVAVIGQVTNGTPGGAIPVGAPVVLHVFSGVEELGAYSTTLADDGSFGFDNLPLQEGQTIVARIVYQGVAYLSGLVTVEAGQQVLSLSITIYEATEDVAALRVSQVHIFVSRVGDRLQMGEYYLVSNTGDRTCVGVDDPDTGRRATLTYTLPDGAENLDFEGPGLGERFLERAEGFADTRPVPPGTATVEVLYSYDLPYREGTRVERGFDVPVTSVVLLVAEGGVLAEDGGLTYAGRLDTEMGPSLSYTAGPFAAGETLAFTLVDPSGSSPVVPAHAVPTRDAGIELVVGVLVLAAGLVTAYLFLRPPAYGLPPAQVQPLVNSIAALDARFEAGDVAEAAYHQRRAALKAQLRVLLEAGEQQPVQG